MGAVATSQINVRIDAELKQAGDEALAAAGLTPTQAVRALWALAKRHASEPEEIVSALEPEETASRPDLECAIREGSGLVEKALAATGIGSAAQPDQRSYDELKRDAYEEASSSAMGWEE